MLVWEVATFGESPHEGIQVGELIGLANNGSLKLNRYTLQKVLSTVCSNLMYYDYIDLQNVQIYWLTLFLGVLQFNQKTDQHLLKFWNATRGNKMLLLLLLILWNNLLKSKIIFCDA